MIPRERVLATDFVRRLLANVDDFTDERIDLGTFSERQRDLWTTVEAAGPEVKRAVLADIIDRLPPPTGRLTPRPTALHRAALTAAAEGRWSSLDKPVQQAIRRLAEDGWIHLDERIPSEARGIGLTAAGRRLLTIWQLAEDSARERTAPSNLTSDERPPHVRAAEFAALAWKTASGNLLHVVTEDDAHGRVDLVVLRDPAPRFPLFPSLVDLHLVWLVLHATSADDPVLTQTIRERSSISTTVHQRPGEKTLQRYADRIAEAARHAVVTPPLPDLTFMEAGRGAWVGAARRSAAAACHLCLYRLGSNLDCPSCKATLRRDPDAAWSTSKIAAALDGSIDSFGGHIYRQAAEAARRALASFATLDLSRDFFDEWADRFAWHTADLFAASSHRHLVRERIEAQMIEPWFELPKHEPARTLALPPVLTPADLAAQLRALRYRLGGEGVPQAEARRRIRTHQCIRRLVAAVAELYGIDALLAGNLLTPAIVIYRDGRPVLRHITTLLGERTYAAPDLSGADRHAIEHRLADLRARLVAAVAQEHTCIDTPDDDGQAIDRALQRLRAQTASHAPAPTPAAPSAVGTPSVTTLTLTPDQRLWLLDLLAGFVEDHDVNADDTDPTPPPANVEWARALADHLSAEIAALADQPSI